MHGNSIFRIRLAVLRYDGMLGYHDLLGREQWSGLKWTHFVVHFGDWLWAHWADIEHWLRKRLKKTDALDLRVSKQKIIYFFQKDNQNALMSLGIMNACNVNERICMAIVIRRDTQREPINVLKLRIYQMDDGPINATHQHLFQTLKTANSARIHHIWLGCSPSTSWNFEYKQNYVFPQFSLKIQFFCIARPIGSYNMPTNAHLFVCLSNGQLEWRETE